MCVIAGVTLATIIVLAAPLAGAYFSEPRVVPVIACWHCGRC